MSDKNMGSSVDDFLREDRIFDETQEQAIAEVAAWQASESVKQSIVPTDERPRKGRHD